MGAVRADGKLELEQQLVGRRPVRVIDVTVLAAHLAELARPVRQQRGCSAVEQIGIVRALRTVEPASREPAARELVIARDVVTHAALPTVELLAVAPDHFAPTNELVIDRARQWTPPECR